MKEYFLWAMAVIIPGAIASWFFWKLGQTFYGMFQDWRLHRELDELQRHAASKRAQRTGSAPEQPTEQDAPAEPADNVDYTTRM